MRYKTNYFRSRMQVASDTFFPEDRLPIIIRRMRSDGVTPTATAPPAFDDSINAPYDPQSDIKADKMALFESSRLSAKSDFVDKRAAAYEARRPTLPVDPTLAGEPAPAD